MENPQPANPEPLMFDGEPMRGKESASPSRYVKHMSIAVDVTALFAIARLTGIQRVVKLVLEGQSEFQLVSFDAQIGAYRMLYSVPPLSPRSENQFAHTVRASVRTFLYGAWLLAGYFLRPVGDTPFFARLKKSASGAYSRFLSATKLPELPKTPVVPLDEIDFLWLLDIPKTAQHQRFLLDKVLPSVPLGVYLYDLIPVEFPDLIDAPDKERLISDFHGYLQLVVNAEVVFCLSDYTRKSLEAYVVKRRLSLRRPPVLVYPPILLNSEVSEVAGQLGSEIPETRVFGLAPLNRRKNLLVVMKAVAGLLRAQEKVSLRFVIPLLGAVDFTTALYALWMRLRFGKRVSLSGPVNDETLKKLYDWCSVVAVPSRAEGYGLPIVEALSQNKPVVAARATSFIELAEVLPIDLADPEDPLDWGSRLVSANLPEAWVARWERVTTSPNSFRALMVSWTETVLSETRAKRR